LMPKSSPQQFLDMILDAARIGEGDDWEFKSARGGFPGSFWETYSAMANAAGGMIVLGAREDAGVVALDGLPRAQIEKHQKTLWDGLNNRGVVNRNLVASGQIQPLPVDTGWLLAVQISRASRTQRPVHLGQNPFGATYIRRGEGDYRCSDEEVRRMFADASDTPADARVLEGFGLPDLDEPSLASYRNLLAATRPAGHPWAALGMRELLTQLGGWRAERETGREGVTAAGLLMFGKHHAITSPEALPKFSVDYRDYRGRNPNERWADRVFPDGTWEANLFQFYRRIWPKLSADLKVPFALKGVQRIDETPVHEALREAVVNAMIHADYQVGGGIVIMHHDDRYLIENPGTLLVSPEQLRRGGVSECRNEYLQRMFFMIGVGEQAGSGFARIQSGWKSQHWRAPRLITQHGPDRVRLEMPMISLMPGDAFSVLRSKLGAAFDGLNEHERMALATAMIEGEVTNTRMQDLVTSHPSDITKLLRGLVAKDLLASDNQRRWTRYWLPSKDSSPLSENSTPLTVSSSPLKSERAEWKAAAATIAAKGKVPREEMESAILGLCKGRYLSLAELATLLDRSPASLRNKTLTPMIRRNLLKYRYPDAPTRPDQAYTVSDE
jgi:ATP-dependent DNA helicase RecG